MEGLAAHCLGGEGWLGTLFYVLFILPRETEEFSVQESRALTPLPNHMKAAEQTGEKSKAIAPRWASAPPALLPALT